MNGPEENHGPLAGAVAPSATRARGDRRPARGVSVAKVLMLAVGGALVAVAGVVLFAPTTAHHWTVIDVPAKEGTTRIEYFPTDTWVVTNDYVSPCAVGQDWMECRDVLLAEHTRECVGRELTWISTDTCALYKEDIDAMEVVGKGEWVVTEVGDHGRLTSTPDTVRRDVSNNDAEPAQTHEAVCYLGFLGECPSPELLSEK